MEKVTVQLVMFKQKTIHEEGEYCGYCPALGAFHVMASFEKLLAYMQGYFERNPAEPIHYKHLKIRGWEVGENFAKPPIFAIEDLVKRTEELFEVKIKEPIIVELYVELPSTRNQYSDLSDTYKDI